MALAAELGDFSFWWTVIPAFLAGSFSVSNRPGFDIAVRANKGARLDVSPRDAGHKHFAVASGCRGHVLDHCGALFKLTRYLAIESTEGSNS